MKLHELKPARAHAKYVTVLDVVLHLVMVKQLAVDKKGKKPVQAVVFV